MRFLQARASKALARWDVSAGRGCPLVARFQDTSGDAQGRLLSHLANDEALDEPGIGDLTFVAVVDAVLLGGRSLAV